MATATLAFHRKLLPLDEAGGGADVALTSGPEDVGGVRENT